MVTLLAALIASPFLGPPSERFWRKRELSHRTEVTSLALPGTADLEVTYRNHAVRELCVVEIYIYNIGNVAITPEMFAEPIVVDLAQLGIIPVDIIEARLTGTAAQGREIEIQESSIRIPPRLINKAESLRLWAMTAGRATPRVTIRVADAKVSEVLPSRGSRDPVGFITLALASVISGTLTGYLSGVPGLPPAPGIARALWGFVVGNGVFLFVYFSTWWLLVRERG